MNRTIEALARTVIHHLPPGAENVALQLIDHAATSGHFLGDEREQLAKRRRSGFSEVDKRRRSSDSSVDMSQLALNSPVSSDSEDSAMASDDQVPMASTGISLPLNTLKHGGEEFEDNSSDPAVSNKRRTDTL